MVIRLEQQVLLAQFSCLGSNVLPVVDRKRPSDSRCNYREIQSNQEEEPVKNGGP